MKVRLPLASSLLLIAAEIPAIYGSILVPRENHIKCLQPGEKATATWTQRDGLICEYTDIVGINYKNPPQVHKDQKTDHHNCMGRCGKGCKGMSIGDAYTMDCFNHDMCTYFNDVDVNKKHRSHNPDCGDEYKHAKGDFIDANFHCPKKDRENPLEKDEDVVPGMPMCHYPGQEPFKKDFGEMSPDEPRGMVAVLSADVVV